MKLNDRQLGKPETIYKASQSDILTLTPEAGQIAYAEDVHKIGFYNGDEWVWSDFTETTPLANTTPQTTGTAYAGTSGSAARSDHVHALETVNLTKIQSLNAYQLLGNSGSSSGPPEQIALGNGLSFSGSSLQVLPTSGSIGYAVNAGNALLLNEYTSAISGANAHIPVTSSNGSLTISGGLNVGTSTNAGTGDIKLSGTIRESTPIACKVKRTSAYTVGNASWTSIPMQTALFEQPSDLDMWSSGTNPSRITCKVAGLYLIIASIKWLNNSTGIRGVAVYLNNSTFIAQDTGPNLGTVNFVMSCNTIQYLNVNDYVECKAYQNSGGNLDLMITDDTTSLSLVKLA